MMDFSDARHVLADARARNEADSAQLSGLLGWDWDWLAEHCLGDGFDKHRLLAAPGCWREQSLAVRMSGSIEDNRGIHSQATFGVIRSRRGNAAGLR